jgi:hypothetical protein
VGVVLLVLPLLLLPVLLTDGCSGYDGIALDLGPASTVSLERLWREVCTEGELDPEGATLDDLRLEYAPSGLLVSVLVDAGTSDGRSVTVNWRGSYSSDEQTVRISATVVSEAMRSSTGSGVLELLTAIDRMGPKSMIALAPASAAGDFYFLSLQRGLTGENGLDPRAPAYLWSDGDFAKLDEADPVREAGTFLALYPMVVTQRHSSTAEDGGVGYGVSLQSTAPIFFALPAGS